SAWGICRGSSVSWLVPVGSEGPGPEGPSPISSCGDVVCGGGVARAVMDRGSKALLPGALLSLSSFSLAVPTSLLGPSPLLSEGGEALQSTPPTSAVIPTAARASRGPRRRGSSGLVVGCVVGVGASILWDVAATPWSGSTVTS